MKVAGVVSCVAVGIGLVACAGNALGQGKMEAQTGAKGFAKDDASIAYPAAFFLGETYDPAVATPESVLGFPLGERPATHGQIEALFHAWADASDRVTLVEYARTYEGRALYYAVVTDPSRLEAGDDPLASLKKDLARAADPRTINQRDADGLVQKLPAVAWLAYSIHGNETSGSDAATALLYHLAASRGNDVRDMLKDLVVIIDPMMNPDGRDRFLKSVDEARSTLPNSDDQSRVHRGEWAAGRTNHYLFDLNRDWILGVHPETRGRVRAINQWHPLLLVDCHEMEPQGTYLFSPSRQPVNPNLPSRRLYWWDVFAKDQGTAFDAFGWRYYTGEWNEEWYPGYSSSWAGFKGAVGILYEQARVAPDGIKRAEGTVLTYRESVHHQLVSSVANLRTLRANRQQMWREFLVERRQSVSGEGPFANRVFLIPPTANATRLRSFLDLLDLQNFEYQRSAGTITADTVDQLGVAHQQKTFPEGTVVIHNQQPEAPLLSAMLGFDPKMSDEFLTEERREILRFGSSKLYDVTAWNLTMLHGLSAYTARTTQVGLVTDRGVQDRAIGLTGDDDATAWVIDGSDDASVVAAARLMEQGIEVRLADKEFTFDNTDFARGSVVITRADNQLFEGGIARLKESIKSNAKDVQVQVIGVGSGLGIGNEVPDLGGEHFLLLECPRIAVVSGRPMSEYDFGATWFTIDRRLGIPMAQLDAGTFGGADLRRYNVLVIPDSFARRFVDQHKEKLAAWVEQGGTQIAIGSTAGAIANESSGLSAVRQLPDVLGDIDEYELALMREIAGQRVEIDADEIWTHEATDDVQYPWQVAPGEDGEDAEDAENDEQADGSSTDVSMPSEDELKRRDDWQQVFMPQGAMAASRIDDRNWLTVGADEVVPVIIGNAPILMTKPPIQTAVRIGALVKGEASERRVGWARLPEGERLIVRMSGLMWPEAAQRLANAAYLTRERKGRGQVILFASSPVFRASSMGTARLMTNALVYGPGAGTSLVIEP